MRGGGEAGMIERNLVCFGVDIHVSIAIKVLILLCINALMVLILLQWSSWAMMIEDRTLATTFGAWRSRGHND